jgi:hypothetical protein
MRRTAASACDGRGFNRMTELLCSRELALRLGAIVPETTKHHRELRDAGHMLVRDGRTGAAMFWKWELTREDLVTARSS